MGGLETGCERRGWRSRSHPATRRRQKSGAGIENRTRNLRFTNHLFVQRCFLDVPAEQCAPFVGLLILERSRRGQEEVSDFFFSRARTAAQRALTARRANSTRRFFESAAVRAGPPFLPPSLPRATAAGFFFLSGFFATSIHCLLPSGPTRAVWYRRRVCHDCQRGSSLDLCQDVATVLYGRVGL